MAKLADVIRRGTRAGQPAATAVAVGTIYYVTDENKTERSNGTTWDDVSDVSAGLADGDKGDITVSASGATWTIDNDVVTYAKMQNVGAESVLARAAGTSGDLSEISLSASQLVGRGSTGDVAAITLGTNLSMSGATLNATGGGSADAITGQAGVGGGKVSWLQNEVNPGGGSDDEFDTTDSSDPLTGWTTLGTPTAHDTNSTLKSHYRLSQASGSGLVGVYKSWSPSAGQYVKTVVNATGTLTTSFQRLGMLIVAEASPGKIAAFGLNYNSGAIDLVVDLWTNRTSLGSTPSATAITGSVVAQMLMRPVYLRIVYNSSTSLDYQFSFNNITWRTLLAGSNPAFTIGAAGLAGNADGAATEAYFDWIRFG